MKTRLQVFSAYLPYHVRAYHRQTNTTKILATTLGDIESLQLILRPLADLRVPMLHPVSGERIDVPADWINRRVFDSGLGVVSCEHHLAGVSYARAEQSRMIDDLALELHFDIYKSKENGWSIALAEILDNLLNKKQE